jgi:YesN/AraC family two-component response regulator
MTNASVPMLLLVDDDQVMLDTLSALLSHSGFNVATASNVPTALKLISAETYDVLLSDLHMPGAGDGLTVVSAMRHSNPRAVTILLSSFPEMNAAARAILLQTDQILIKSMEMSKLVEAIRMRIASGPSDPSPVESVATILERSQERAIQEWLTLVQRDSELAAIQISRQLRCKHLPQLIRDLVLRLRSNKELGSKEVKSTAAAQHGVDRRKQGYTAAMMVQESRLLQVSLFKSLQENLASIDFSVLLIEVMTIADEIDSQLAQSMQSYLAAPLDQSLIA